MLLKSKFTGPHHAMYVPIDSAKLKSERDGREGFANPQAHAKVITLMPGINAVDTEVWEEAKRCNPQIAALLVEVEGLKDIGLEKVPHTFEPMVEEIGEYDPKASDKDVVVLVQNCVQVEFLRALKKHTKSVKVLDAIQKQMDKIDGHVLTDAEKAARNNGPRYETGTIAPTIDLGTFKQ